MALLYGRARACRAAPGCLRAVLDIYVLLLVCLLQLLQPVCGSATCACCLCHAAAMLLLCCLPCAPSLSVLHCALPPAPCPLPRCLLLRPDPPARAAGLAMLGDLAA
jgi:hypothetical protein